MPARKSSNKKRIARAAEEAAATDSERKTKKKTAKKKTAKKKAARTTAKKTFKKATTATGRLVVVWTVRDHLRRVVKTYAYHDQADAAKEAARLTKSSGKDHVVRRDRAPLEE